MIFTLHRSRWLLAAMLAPLPAAFAQPSTGPDAGAAGVHGGGGMHGYEPEGDVAGGDQGARDAALARRLVAAGRILPLARVVSEARALRPGILIGAGLHRERHHRGYLYEVWMLDAAGIVWELEFDASTGQLIEHERGGR